MSKRLTIYELGFLEEGTPLTFAVDYSGVPAGAAAKVKENGLNEIWSGMLVEVDDPTIDGSFYTGRSVHVSGGDPGDDARMDPEWQELSPFSCDDVVEKQLRDYREDVEQTAAQGAL